MRWRNSISPATKVEVEKTGIERLAAREGKQPLGERRRALGAKDRVRDGALYPDGRSALGFAPALGDVEIAQNDHQQVVEVMRDAAGELADRLHALHLQHALVDALEMLLRKTLFRHVARDLAEADQRAGRIEDRVDHHARPETVAALADAPAFRFEAALRLGLAQSAPRHVDGAVLLGIEQREMLADDLFLPIPLDALGPAVPARNPAGGIEHEDRVVVDALDHQFKLGRAALEAALRLVVRGDLAGKLRCGLSKPPVQHGPQPAKLGFSFHLPVDVAA